MLFSQGRSLPSIRSKLIILVLACAAPIVAGYLAFAHDADRRERAHIAQDADMIVRALAAAVDRDLDSAATAARVLANQSSLATGDLAAFQMAARRLLRPEFPVAGFELSGADGRALLDARHPLGAAPPDNGNEADVRAVFASGNAVTSGLHRASPGQPWLASITVPVWRDGRVAYALSVELRPQRLNALLAGQQLPESWNARIFDNHQRLVARSGPAERGIGMPIRPELAQALAHADLGQVALLGRDAGRVYIAYARTLGHGWAVTIGYPYHAEREILGTDPATSLAGIGAMLALSLTLAWVIGGGIARSVRALTGPAAALGRGEALAIPPLAIREAASVAAALRQVEGELQQYRAGLEALVAERTKELRRSSALLSTVYASAPVGLAYLDADLRIVMVNDYLAAVNALTASAHIGRTLPELLGERGVHFEAPYRRVLASGRALIDVEDSVEVPAEPGVMRYWICSYYPVYGPERELAGINAVVLDITERKLQEQRERDNQELFRALFEGAGDAQVLLVPEAGFISANPAAVKLYGCASLEELLAMSPANTSPELQPNGRRSSELAHETMMRALAQGGCHFEWLHQRRDGSLFHADVLLTAVDMGGRRILQGTIRDITARVETELRLERSERMVRAITDHLPGLVGYWDAGLRCRFANRPYLEWLGRSVEEVIGHTAAELMDAEQMFQVQPYLDGVLAGRAQFFERRLQRRGYDKVIYAWGSYIPDLDLEGRVRGFYMLHADVTELKGTQSRLEQALRAAEAASSAKGEFLANMSHEIRTPMNAIIGLARLLEEAQLGRRERGYVARIGMAAKSLLSMLNDVLDYSKVEAGQLALERTAFRLDDVLSGIALLTATSAWNKGIEPVFAVAPDVPRHLLGDPMRLEQVLLNLVGNAIKFTESGEVVLSIRVEAQDAGSEDSGVRLAFSVRDSGIGIALAQQQRMFEAFSQADSSTSRKYGGTGLGLAISRRLVDLMGGHLDVDSRPGEGATFGFSAAFALAPAPGPMQGPDAAPPAAHAGAALHVLVADDNASSRAALAAMLRARGWQVDVAAGGVEALALLAHGAYCLAFIDSAMPDLDGASVLARSRAHAGAPPRVALMAADPDHERLDAMAADLRVDALLAKPFTPQAVDAAAAALLGAVPDEPSHPLRVGSALAARLAGLRVLVVEDNPLNQEVAQFVLAQAGATVDFAGNGRIGVDLLAGGMRYDAVLMDLQMPVMDGFEATGAIRRLGLPVPIVAMTANAFEDDRRRALGAGMDAWVAKPIDVDELVATLARVTGRAAGAAPAQAPVAAPAAAPALPGIDLAAALPRIRGDVKVLAELLARFAASHADDAERIRAELAEGRRTRAAQAAHRLHGVAANLGASEVARLAAELEQRLPSGDTAALESRLAGLDAALGVVRASAQTLAAAHAPGVDAAGARPADDPDLPRALAQLVDLLQNNNMKAMALWESLRPTLQRLAPHAEAVLADAVAELRFDDAAGTLRELMTTMETG
ncbi:response regulator [Massilia sp. 9096]|uniref:response regulator n=1 Tax=Massilia sp. 9096 TaxID=1500894 RepID=UPI0005635598|nr:response regulator [Massilia sp. 9096]